MSSHLGALGPFYEIQTAAMRPNTCVQCGQPLPANSRLLYLQIATEEAARNDWASSVVDDSHVVVTMCLQCQIDRSKSKRETQPTGTGGK